MAKVSPILILPPLVFLAFGALFLFGLGRKNPNELPSTLTGQPAPALSVTPLGKFPQIKDAALRVPPVKLVNFWASWCAPCRAEHPQLMAMKEQGIPIYGVNYKDEAGNALNFLKQLGNPFYALGQDSGRQAINWGVYGVPETFVINSKGKILLRFPGPITKGVLKNKILPLIRQAQKQDDANP